MVSVPLSQCPSSLFTLFLEVVIDAGALLGPSYPRHRPSYQFLSSGRALSLNVFVEDAVQAESYLYDIVIVPAGSLAYSQ